MTKEDWRKFVDSVTEICKIKRVKFSNYFMYPVDWKEMDTHKENLGIKYFYDTYRKHKIN